MIPHLKRLATHTQFIVDGHPFIMLAGELHNSSGSDLPYLEQALDRVVAAHCNTAIVPVYWELLEPEDGHFDFSLVDGMLDAARRRRLRLVVLWFGTWKNAASNYVPAWVKTDTAKFYRAQTAPGLNSHTISPLCTAARDADARAFAALLRHLKEKDDDIHTVIMVQVENETGLLGAPRDMCPAAAAAYAGPVPPALTGQLAAERERLLPAFVEAWTAAGGRMAGTWEEVFGFAAPEVFMAWHVAGFVNTITAAGKAEFPLPMYANAWLVQQPGQRPGAYPSGGPVARMMDIWRVAAPAIDFLAPDIYLPQFQAVCAEYSQGGNVLMIPEAAKANAQANAFAAIAQHNAICFAPFGIDSLDNPAPLAETYDALSELMPLVARHQGSGRMLGIAQDAANMPPIQRRLGGFHLEINFNRTDPGTHPPGRGLIIALSDTEYLVAGAGFWVQWRPLPSDTHQIEFLAVDEGIFRNGIWYPSRRLNGDEACGEFQRFDDTISMRKVKLHRFA